MRRDLRDFGDRMLVVVRISRPLNGIATFGIATWHRDQSGLSHFHVRTCSYTLVAPRPPGVGTQRAATRAFKHKQSNRHHGEPLSPDPRHPLPLASRTRDLLLVALLRSLASSPGPLRTLQFRLPPHPSSLARGVASTIPGGRPRRQRSTGESPRLCGGEDRTGGVRDGGRCSVRAGERLGGAGRGPVSL